MKRPSFQFYPADWRKDPGVQSLSYHDRGVWFEIICLLHESEERGKLLLNGKPMPEDALARLLGLDKQKLNQTLSILIDFGVAQRCEATGALMNRRMVRDENLSKIRAESGKLGGNPALLNQKPKQNTTTRLKQNPTPSSSASSSDPPKAPQGADGDVLELDADTQPKITAEEIYAAYPLKKSKPDAITAIKKAMRRVAPEFLLERTQEYRKVRNGDMEFVPNPSTWYNRERYNDDPSTWPSNGNRQAQPPPQAHPTSLAKIPEPERWKVRYDNHPASYNRVYTDTRPWHEFSREEQQHFANIANQVPLADIKGKTERTEPHPLPPEMQNLFDEFAAEDAAKAAQTAGASR